MLVIFNTKKDNETYRIPCPSPSPINPQHTIDVWGLLRPSTISNNNDNRRQGILVLVLFKMKKGQQSLPLALTLDLLQKSVAWDWCQGTTLRLATMPDHDAGEIGEYRLT